MIHNIRSMTTALKTSLKLLFISIFSIVAIFILNSQVLAKAGVDFIYPGCTITIARPSLTTITISTSATDVTAINISSPTISPSPGNTPVVYYSSNQSRSFSWNTSGEPNTNFNISASVTDDNGNTSTCSTTLGPPTPNIDTSGSECINPGNDGSGIEISWITSSFPVTWANISTDNFTPDSPYYHKDVRRTTRTNGTGFNDHDGATNGDLGELTYDPGTTYYVKLWDDYLHSTTAEFSITGCAVTLSGRVTNSVTNTGISGVEINQGVTGCNLGTQTTNANGDFAYTDIPFNMAFCMRAPGLSGYTGPDISYEYQTAGSYVDNGYPAYPDQSVDNAYNFIYNACPAAGTIPACSTSSGSVPDGSCGTRPYWENCETTCSGSICVQAPWIQTNDGDVHSNINIDLPPGN